MQVIWSDISILPYELIGDIYCQKSVLYLKVEVAWGGGGVGFESGDSHVPYCPKIGTLHGGFLTLDRRSWKKPSPNPRIGTSYGGLLQCGIMETTLYTMRLPCRFIGDLLLPKWNIRFQLKVRGISEYEGNESLHILNFWNNEDIKFFVWNVARLSVPVREDWRVFILIYFILFCLSAHC